MLRILGNLENGYNELINMDTISQDMLMDIGVQKISKGEAIVFFEDDKEIVLSLMEGKLIFKCGDINIEASRRSVFDEDPQVLHFPRKVKAVVEAIDDCEILVQKTTNANSFTPKFYGGLDCRHASWGEGIWDETAKRNVRFIIEYKTAPYSNLVMGEVVNFPGRWSTFPPHTHDQPEVYFYRFNNENGFGAGFVGDKVFRTQHNSATCIPCGNIHPQVSIPGYPMYYCWMMRHLDDNPFSNTKATKHEDERYQWLSEENAKIWPDK